ncbi:MAG: triose-phosphate isomerase, partial [Dokdonella sp.]
MRRPLVAGNWKMHGSRAMAADLVGALAAAAPNGVDVAVLPPFPYLDGLIALYGGSAIAFGAQDLSEHAQGAYTGEVAGAMLKDIGCRYVLVGHSERRQYHAESNATVAAKFVAAQAAGLLPILCVGETLADREGGTTEAIIAAQLEAVVARARAPGVYQALVGEQPVVAKGTRPTPSPAPG